MALRDVFEAQSEDLTESLESFSELLIGMLLRAQRDVLERLREEADDQGRLRWTQRNVRLANRVDRLFVEAMEAAGYPQMVDGYVEGFATQFTFLDDLIAELIPDRSAPPFTARDRQQFATMALQMGTLLDNVIEDAGIAARRRALFGVGGVSVGDIADALERDLLTVRRDAATIAVTAKSTFFRAIQSKQYERIEEERGPLRYNYVPFPLDVVTRAWCAWMIQQSKAGVTWTRAEIQALVSHSLRGRNQPTDVMLTCGGYNCRHGFLPVL